MGRCSYPGCVDEHKDLDEREPRNAGHPPARKSEIAAPVAAPAPVVPRHFKATVGPKALPEEVFSVGPETFNPETHFRNVFGDIVEKGPYKLMAKQEVPKSIPVGLAGDAATRKASPIASGVLWYFPNALAAVAALSKVGNDQHNPGQPMHWAYDKSTDEADCIVRHLADAGTVDADGVRHATKVAWRALALLERELLAAHPELQPGKNVRGFKR